MNKLNELLEKRSALVKEMEGIFTLADEEKRDLTEDEETRYTELEKEIEAVEAAIEKAKEDEERRSRLQTRKDDQEKIRRQPPRMAATYRAEDPKEFKNLGEFIHAIRFNPADARLYDLFEQRTQSMGVGADGGFAVPTQFRPQLLSVDPQEAIFRPRATIIEAGDPPDSEVSMPALDQGSSQNIYGGVVVTWISEGAAKPETGLKLREITLKPKEVAGHIIVTDKLLRNWMAADAVISNQLRLAMIGAEETAFYSGNGATRPLGILNSPARIDYARATASQIAYADVAGMLARSTVVRRGGAGIWIASQTTIPQLTTIQDAASQYIWVQNAASGMPPSLFGYPVLFHDRSVALGTRGDLCLVDLGYYLIKNGSGPFIAASPHFYFTENKTVIKAFWNVDGSPWLNEPIPLEGSTTNTISPFVILQ